MWFLLESAYRKEVGMFWDVRLGKVQKHILGKFLPAFTGAVNGNFLA
jgi:hypothetical protein